MNGHGFPPVDFGLLKCSPQHFSHNRTRVGIRLSPACSPPPLTGSGYGYFFCSSFLHTRTLRILYLKVRGYLQFDLVVGSRPAWITMTSPPPMLAKSHLRYKDFPEWRPTKKFDRIVFPSEPFMLMNSYLIFLKMGFLSSHRSDYGTQAHIGQPMSGVGFIDLLSFHQFHSSFVGPPAQGTRVPSLPFGPPQDRVRFSRRFSPRAIPPNV